jgi:ABC-type branched-subunit amino acid transport system substrate-binding protein
MHTTRRFSLALLLIAVPSACDAAAPAATGTSAPSATQGPASASPSTFDTLKVAYVQDLAPEQALATTLPPLQAVELAFATAASAGRTSTPIDVVAFDTQGDPTTGEEVTQEIASDPSFVAAFAAPNLGGLRELVEILGPEGVPLLSLSARDAVQSAEPGTFLRFVAPLADQASSLADGVNAWRRPAGDVCLVLAPTDGTRFSNAVRQALSPGPLVFEEDATGEVPEVPLPECGVVVWTGDGVGGAALAISLEEAPDPHPILIGGPGLREPDFLGEAGRAAEGAVAFCSCADLSTAVGLGAQRFIQDYQSEFGSPPGPYAVEAWDAARMVIGALDVAGPSRDGLIRRLASTPRFEGLGGAYAFAGSELAEPAAAVRTYRVEGGRWTAVDGFAGP